MDLENENHNNKRQQTTGPPTITKTSIHRYQINSFIITMNPEYSSLVYPLSDLEYLALKNSIKEDGLHYPITVNSQGEVLDGHHRYKISKELNLLPIRHEVKYFKDSIEEKKFVIEINLKRRHLNSFQIAELEYKMEEIYKERAKLRSFSNLKNVKENISEASNDAIEVNKDKNEETGKV